MPKITKAGMRRLTEQSQKKMEKVFFFYLVNANPKHKQVAEIMRLQGLIIKNLK